MTTQAIEEHDARGLVSAMHDTDFDWTVERLPALVEQLGWTIAEEIPGEAAIADTTWGVPDVDVEMTFGNGYVDMMTIRLTGPNAKDDTDQDVLQNTFATVAALMAEQFGTPTSTTKGIPREAQWTGDKATISLRLTDALVRIIWARNAYQEIVDTLDTQS